MRRKWLILDVSGLAYRAHYTTGDLTHNGKPTGVLYGFFAEMLRLEEKFGTGHFAFCFDGGHELRKEVWSSYKSRRKVAATDPLSHAREMVRVQVKQLREDLLPSLGYENLFMKKNYEADDLIASACHNLRSKDTAVIVSGDKDMYQLVSANVSQYSPTSREDVLVTPDFLRERFGLKDPAEWATVKAIAGEPPTGDNYPGCKGVKEITAARFVSGKLPQTYKAWGEIVKWVAGEDMLRNLKLCRLPFDGTPKVKLSPDYLPNNIRPRWSPVMRSLGITTLERRADHRRGVKT